MTGSGMAILADLAARIRDVVGSEACPTASCSRRRGTSSCPAAMRAGASEPSGLSEMVGGGIRLGDGKIAVQEACHHWNVQQLRGRAAEFLRGAGATVVALPRGAGCCGAAGLWSAQQPEAAWRLLQPLLDAIEGSGCDAVSISNPGYLFHIRAGLRARGSKVRALHLAELLDAGGSQGRALR